MTVKNKVERKSRTHQRYYLKSGELVPGATTVTGLLNKPALIPWANKLGLKGIEVGKYVDELATIGTLIHYMIECHLKGKKPDFGDYTKNQIDAAENGFLKYLDWEKRNNAHCLESELQLVSEKHKYGGTIDSIMSVGNKVVLIDFKSSKGIFPGHFLQVGGGYYPLALENGYKIDEVRIIRVGREEKEGFDDLTCPMIDLQIRKFRACLEIYHINKQMKGGNR